jgi:MYXO-CTERM domain-containing protein
MEPTTLRIICGALALILLAVILLRRRGRQPE